MREPRPVAITRTRNAGGLSLVPKKRTSRFQAESVAIALAYAREYDAVESVGVIIICRKS
jgi:hypothetical protein